MFRRFLRETGRLCRTKQTWLLVAVMVLCPISTATDFLGLGSRVYNTTISNVLMLNPARLSLYIGAFSIMVFTLLQLRQLYSGGTYVIVESAVNPVAQILLQTIAICVITIASVCVALLVLCPYTAIVMKELFSLAKFMHTWVYVYLLGLLISVLLTSGVFLIFRNFEVSLILMSALMLFSISRPTESYYLTHWLQTSVTSITDGTESLLRFKVMLFSRLIDILVGVGIYTIGLLCVRRYSKGILGSVIWNMRNVVIPLLLVICIAASVFYVNHDPVYWKDKNDITLLTEYVINPEMQTIELDESADSELRQRLDENEEQYNLNVRWMEMNTETTIESDSLHGKTTYVVTNLSAGSKEQELTVTITRGIRPTQILCNGEPLDFFVGDFNFADSYYYHFTLPAGLETATLEILFEGFPKGSTDYAELGFSITNQYVELAYEFPELMTRASDVRNFTVSLPNNLTLFIPGAKVKEIVPIMEGYHTYTFAKDRTEGGLLYYYIFAGDYCMEAADVGGVEIQFFYFRNKEKIMEEIGAMDIIKDVFKYFTDLYGPLDFGEEPLILAETERDGSSGWWIGNLCGIAESAIVSSLYQADPENPDAARSAGLQSLVKIIAKQWWNGYTFGAVIDYSWQAAFTNYSTYLYMKHLYGEKYAIEALKEPWYKTAEIQQNAFYWCNKQYTSILSLKDAIEIYLPYQNQEKEYINTAALFHAEQLVGGEDVLVGKLAEIYDEFKGGEEVFFENYQFLYYDLFLEKLGVTKEELEAW